MDRSAEVIGRARSQVDRSCYVWGALGQDLCAQKNVESFVRGRETTGDAATQAANVRRVMQRYQKLRNKGMTSILCFDCSGFIYWTFKAFTGLISARRNAAGLYGQCKDKQRGQLRAGDLVFVHNGSRITHVGLYSGEGMVIHCKGRDVGVIEELISKHGWNRYGKVKGMYDDEPQPIPPGTYVFTRVLRYGDKGEDVVELKKLLIAHGYTTGITIDTTSSPVFGGQTRARVKEYQTDHNLKVDGIAGRETITSLGGVFK